MKYLSSFFWKSLDFFFGYVAEDLWYYEKRPKEAITTQELNKIKNVVF